MTEDNRKENILAELNRADEAINRALADTIRKYLKI